MWRNYYILNNDAHSATLRRLHRISIVRSVAIAIAIVAILATVDLIRREERWKSVLPTLERSLNAYKGLGIRNFGATGQGVGPRFSIALACRSISRCWSAANCKASENDLWARLRCICALNGIQRELTLVYIFENFVLSVEISLIKKLVFFQRYRSSLN